MASESDDLEQQLRQNINLRRQLGVAAAEADNKCSECLKVAGPETSGADDSLEMLRLEIKLKRAMEAPFAAKELVLQSENPKAHWDRWLSVNWKAGIASLVCLTLGAFVVIWLIY